MSVSNPENLQHLFAERANARGLNGLIARYQDGAGFVGRDGTDASGSDAIVKT